MKLRRAGPNDAARLSLIGCATFLETFANDHDGDEVVRYLGTDQSAQWYADRLGQPGFAAWLCEEAEGCPVGYAVSCPAGLPGTDPATDYELKRIYLLSKWQQKRLGPQLYEVVEAEARAQGAKRLVLSVYVTNLPAQRFYTARGFEIVGRWLFEGFGASEDFIMAKTL